MSIKKYFKDLNERWAADAAHRYKVQKQWEPIYLCQTTEMVENPKLSLAYIFVEHLFHTYGIRATYKLPRQEIEIVDQKKYLIFLMKYGHAKIDESGEY